MPTGSFKTDAELRALQPGEYRYSENTKLRVRVSPRGKIVFVMLARFPIDEFTASGNQKKGQ